MWLLLTTSFFKKTFAEKNIRHSPYTRWGRHHGSRGFMQASITQNHASLLCSRKQGTIKGSPSGDIGEESRRKGKHGNQLSEVCEGGGGGVSAACLILRMW